MYDAHSPSMHRTRAETHNAGVQARGHKCNKKEEKKKLTFLVMDGPVSQLVAEFAVGWEYQCCLGYADRHILIRGPS